jgi:hypothetical protein
MKCTAYSNNAATFAPIARDANKPLDQSFTVASSPTAALTMTIDDPEYQSSIKVGDYYYIEVVRARAVITG